MKARQAGGQGAAEAAEAAVIAWIQENAHPVTSLDGDADLADLEPLRQLVGDAAVVGLGASIRTARELFTLPHRMVRFLVEEHGFRTIALEEDWTLGVQLDQHLRRGEGGLKALLSAAWPPWQVQELVDLLTWARDFNLRHPDDPVRLLGVDAMAVQALAYDDVLDHVTRVAPGRSPELEALYRGLRPSGSVDAHIEWYQQQEDKQAIIDRAGRAHALVASLPVEDGSHIAVQHARAIQAFYEFHGPGGLAAGEHNMAETAALWHEHTGSKVVYLGGLGHVAVADPLITPSSPSRKMVGSHLRDRFASGYLAVAVMFDHGEVSEGYVKPPGPAFPEAILGQAGHAAYLMDLRGPQRPEVRAWLEAAARARLLGGPFFDPADDANYFIEGSSLAGWFDAVAHIQQVTPAHPL